MHLITHVKQNDQTEWHLKIAVKITCRGRMKLDIKESMEQSSHKEEIAWQASIPSSGV
jgi:hypothetical protein